MRLKDFCHTCKSWRWCGRDCANKPAPKKARKPIPTTFKKQKRKTGPKPKDGPTTATPKKEYPPDHSGPTLKSLAEKKSREKKKEKQREYMKKYMADYRARKRAEKEASK